MGKCSLVTGSCWYCFSRAWRDILWGVVTLSAQRMLSQARRGTGVAASSSFPNKGVAWAAERLQGCWCGGARAECCSLGAGWAEKAVQVSWKDGNTRGFPWVLPQSSSRCAPEETRTVARNSATSPAFRLLIQRGKMSSVTCGWTLQFVSGSCREQIQARAECLGSYVSQCLVTVWKNGMCDSRGGKQRGFPHLCFHIIVISHECHNRGVVVTVSSLYAHYLFVWRGRRILSGALWLVFILPDLRHEWLSTELPQKHL